MKFGNPNTQVWNTERVHWNQAHITYGPAAKTQENISDDDNVPYFPTYCAMVTPAGRESKLHLMGQKSPHNQSNQAVKTLLP